MNEVVGNSHMWWRRFVFFLTIVFLISSFTNQTFANAVDISEENVRNVKSYVEKQFERAEIVGGSYAIVANNEVIDSSGVGYSDLKGQKRATAETIYAIASVTKVFTATAILSLHEQGKLNLQDSVQKYLPWFTYKDIEKSKEVTIEHLLTHSAGVDRYKADGAIFEDEKNNRNSLENAIKTLSTVEMTSDPGEKGQYCNSCYNILGLIIEKVTGMSYYDYMQMNVFQRLDLESTAFGHNLNQTQDIAKEYSWFFGFRNTRLLNYETFGASQDPEGGIYSNSLDLAKYVAATLGPSPWLSTDTLEMSYEGVVPTEHEGWAYSIGGFEVSQYDNQTLLYKGGDGIGSSSAIMLLPEENIGVVLIIGESNSEPKQEIAMGMLQILIGKEPLKLEFAPPLFKIAGWAILLVLLVNIIFLVFLVRTIRKSKTNKYRWLWIFLSLICFILFVVIGFLLWKVRPTQIGFYGYPYDIAIGLVSLEVMLLIIFVCNSYLSIVGKGTK
ncbi:CubicO group peptidase (beta-lactamase class C family) [Ureibacillus xyleni]|uniref:CubicO group peptidase (Beta-lactamase class C family) n=2 Tax=Ureibacillus xyleni TaxID=614648 RepID=A0A285SXK8_9BACL|nr:CubicO group peptidase (beta-lactamase class C family) [Ureibacillus xyleni]